MVPIDEVVPLSAEKSLDENLEIMAEHQYVRFPLVSDGEEFSGVIYVPQVLARLDDLREGRAQLSELATPSVHVRTDWSVARVIDAMQECPAGDGAREERLGDRGYRDHHRHLRGDRWRPHGSAGLSDCPRMLRGLKAPRRRRIVAPG